MPRWKNKNKVAEQKIWIFKMIGNWQIISQNEQKETASKDYFPNELSLYLNLICIYSIKIKEIYKSFDIM